MSIQSEYTFHGFIDCINSVASIIVSYQFKLKKMRAKLANLNHGAVPFLSQAAANLCWY